MTTKHTPATPLAASEFKQASALWQGKLGLHVIQFPSGKWGYVGSVPAKLFWADGTTEKQIQDAAQFGAGFVTPKPIRRCFNTKEAAEQFAAAFTQ